jgi:hypothetical protein
MDSTRHRERAACVSEVQESLLEQTAQSGQKYPNVRAGSFGLVVSSFALSSQTHTPMSLDSTVSEVEATVKKKRPEYIIGVWILLIASLCGVIFWGYLYGLLERTGEVIPRRVLGVTIVLLLVLWLSFLILTVHYYRKLRASLTKHLELQNELTPLKSELQTKSASLEKAGQENRQLKEQIEQLETASKTLLKFGVFWDENLQPYCPVHTTIPLSNWIHLHRNSGYMCPINGHMISLRDDNGHRLTPREARNLLRPVTTNPQPKAQNEKLEIRLELLNSFRDNLPKYEMDESDLAEYHSHLETIEKELNCDLTEFRIPPSAIKSREIPLTVTYMHGQPMSDPYDYEQYIPPEVFKRKLDAVISHLDKKRS